MLLRQVALQCYTIRAHCQTAPEFAESMRRVRQIGYPAVQISGIGPIESAEVRRICDGEGLAICATHEPGATIVNDPQAVVDRLGTLGCRFTAYPYPHIPYDSASTLKSVARQLNAAGEVLRRAGMTLAYHNHAIEFRKFDDRTSLDILYSEMDPALVNAELDTYWVQAGGGDPVAWCARLAGRLSLLHMKDYAIDADHKPAMAEVGSGNLDFPRIATTAESSGCKWFIVEQDHGFTDAFDAAAKSFRYVKERLVGAT
jgi:sugar phosphate isomerase/epimerase